MSHYSFPKLFNCFSMALGSVIFLSFLICQSFAGCRCCTFSLLHVLQIQYAGSECHCSSFAGRNSQGTMTDLISVDRFSFLWSDLSCYFKMLENFCTMLLLNLVFYSSPKWIGERGQKTPISLPEDEMEILDRGLAHGDLWLPWRAIEFLDTNLVNLAVFSLFPLTSMHLDIFYHLNVCL